jgi:hypothetical protein
MLLWGHTKLKYVTFRVHEINVLLSGYMKFKCYFQVNLNMLLLEYKKLKYVTFRVLENETCYFQVIWNLNILLTEYMKYMSLSRYMKLKIATCSKHET